jgi:tetrapyrrole methylase family protein/MazG family protein
MDTGQEFTRLLEIMKRLRAECPWDREQTHSSLRQYLIEETYEVIDHIDNDEIEELQYELGDVLLQIVFHSELASEKGRFTIADVIRHINAKLIRRHPHVFTEDKVESSVAVKKNWEAIKRRERGRGSALSGVPHSAPALLQAENLQRKAAAAGFDWPDTSGIWEKIAEELDELRRAIAAADTHDIESEFGDVLFSLVNLGRHLSINSENSLRQSSAKFRHRFQQMEAIAATSGQQLAAMSLPEMESLWQRVKASE